MEIPSASALSPTVVSPPVRMRENTSRPRSSVPNQWAALGPWSLSAVAVRLGSCGAIQGPMISSTRKTATAIMTIRFPVLMPSSP